jgi:hypothetical protein
MAKNDGKDQTDQAERDRMEQPGDVPDIHEQADRVLSGEAVSVNHGPGEGLGPQQAEPTADEGADTKPAKSTSKKAGNGASGTQSS